MASRGRSNYSAHVKKYRRPDNEDDDGAGRGGGADGDDFGQNDYKNKDNAFKDDDEEEEAQATSKRFADIEVLNELDEQMGFVHYAAGPPKMGWMLNMKTTFIKDPEWPAGRSAVDYYFLEEDGSYFRSTLPFSPYFLLRCKPGTETMVEDYLRKKFENTIESIARVDKEDLELPNHLSGRKGRFLKLSFRNNIDLSTVRRVLLPAVQRNTELAKERGLNIDEFSGNTPAGSSNRKQFSNPESYGLNNIVDLREYDLPYHLRVNIDLSIRCGLWYNVTASMGSIKIERIKDKNVRPDPVVFAFDIETSKLPLKFPDAQNDPIMMISYMIDGKGYLVNNRNIISKDLENFEYTPKSEYLGKFSVFSEADEKAMLLRFFSHIQLVRPAIYVTYNGDQFDWPYIENRCKILGIDMKEQCGVVANAAGEYSSSNASHMDCYRWVKRDSYLPAGSQGLKAVTSAKLGYDPLELDPELMVDLARTDPQTLANYSVSDAVATYYLYMKYVNPFIFSLCNIIPLTPDEVLRKGSGTLCETLLMAEAFVGNISMPNKHTDPKERFHNGHLIESETYIGGHVEALESGVFRSDIPCKFKMAPEALEQLIKDLDRALRFSLEKEGGVKDFSLVTNYEQVKNEIEGKLKEMLENPNRTEGPLIYHLDVAAMYPNIILTNRLQPPAIVDESMCAMCDFNKPGKTCQRKMTWSWRGEFYTAKRSEYRMIKNQIESERFALPYNPKRIVPFLDLPENERHRLLCKRLGEYSQKVYKRTRTNEIIQKTSIVCQRENSFYVDTVRNFRDRRYDYKALHKQSKKKLEEAIAQNNPTAIDEWSKMHTIYDSLQVAHKCILNSFYGYVMRKGARWYSMEMAGIVCETGAAIIRLARQLVEQIGRPLELDTDGIWCMLPAAFPENFTFELSNGKKHSFAYPCVMLNHLVHDQFTNDQYQSLVEPKGKKYTVSSENSIFFEIDGPYRAMILPSSTEEGKLLKKRYAVFAEDGKLAELKGFEIKRRGELKMIKLFQSQLFKTFLDGDSLQSCYAAVARVADYWLDILHTKGAHLTDQELFELISENRSMSRSLEDYGEQKSTSISTARRLAEFLGDEMVKDKGLACKFIISIKPVGDPVASRAIPVAIFSAEPEVKRHYLRKWCRDPAMTDFDIRTLLDWQYYLERLESVIQKLILIPAAMQHVPNPVPRVTSPDWIRRFVERMSIGGASSTSKKQLKMTDLFSKRDSSSIELVEESAPVPAQQLDIEDLSSKKRVRFAESVVDNEQQVKSEPTADISTDYAAWVRSQKSKWRQIRAKIADPLLSSSTANSANSQIWSRSRVSSKEQILSSTWDVLHIESQPDQSGLFNMYILVSGTIRKIVFKRPRKIFVHCHEPINFPADSLPLVHYKLPYASSDGDRSASSKIIYEITADEGDFMTNYQQYSAFLCHPNVAGIYEATIPLEFLNLIELGTKISVEPSVRKFRDPLNGSFVFGSTDFIPDRIEGSTLNYSSIRYLYIYHLHTDNRHVFLLYCSRGVSIASVIIVDPAGKRQVPNLKGLFSLIQKEIHSESEVKDDLPFDLKQVVPEFEIDLVSEYSNALKLIKSKLSALLKLRSDGPLVGLFSSSATTSNSSNLLKSLKNTFTSPSDPSESPIPLISIPPLDSVYLPPLDWQRFGLKRGIEGLFTVNRWLAESVSLARFAQIPLGNIAEIDSSRSVYSFISDVFLSRELKQKGFLLSHQLDSDLNSSNSSKSDSYFDDSSLIDLEMERSGVSENVTVELDIIGFSLNCLLQYQSILGSEGADGIISSTAGLYPIIRSLVKGWFQNSFVDDSSTSTSTSTSTSDSSKLSLKLTSNFHQWILPSKNSPTSASQIITERSNLFSSLQLILRRALGLLSGITSSITSMSPFLLTPSKLVMMTRAHLSVENAQAFIEYFQNQIVSRDEFQFLQFYPSKWWKCLIWMDKFNYSGVCGDIEDDNNYSTVVVIEENEKDTILYDDDQRTTDEATSTSASASASKMNNSSSADEIIEIDMNWLLIDYLPQIYHESFLKSVQSFTECLFLQISQDSDDAITFDDISDIEDLDTGNGSTTTNSYLNDPTDQAIGDLEDQPTTKNPSMNMSMNKTTDDNTVNTNTTTTTIITAPTGINSRSLPFSFTQNFLLVLQELIKMTQSEPFDERDRRYKQTPKSVNLNEDMHSLKLNLNLKNQNQNDMHLLNFVKYLGAIFSLHPTLASKTVPSLLKQAFTLIGVREFSDSTMFTIPFGKLKIKNISCRGCGFVQSIDLAKNEKVFACADPSCRQPFHQFDLELALLSHIKLLLLNYQKQDLTCSNCRLPTPATLTRCCPSCPNATKLTLMQRTEVTRNTFLVAGQVAKSLKMLTVQHFIDSTININ